jgi:hypothetical protein
MLFQSQTAHIVKLLAKSGLNFWKTTKILQHPDNRGAGGVLACDEQTVCLERGIQSQYDI